MSPFEVEIIKKELSDAKRVIKELQIENMELSQKLSHKEYLNENSSLIEDIKKLQKDLTAEKMQHFEARKRIRELERENKELTKNILPGGQKFKL